MNTGLEDKTWQYGLTVGLLLAALIVGGLWYLSIAPMNEEKAALDREFQDLQVDISKGRAAQANLPGLIEQIENLELELDKLLRILPARRNTPELIRRIRLLVERGDFNLKQFRPGNPVEQEFYSEWPIRISLDGNYHNLALFFDRIARFSRIINIDNLNITNARGGEYTIAADFTAKTFIYREPEPEEDLSAGGTGAAP